MAIVSAHREALLSLLSQAATANKCMHIVKVSQDLFAECLAPFEFTHRGFMELESLNLKLEAANKDLEREITERKRAEEALRESEKIYHNLFGHVTEEVHFWELVHNENGEITNWRLVDANPPTLITWGRRRRDQRQDDRRNIWARCIKTLHVGRSEDNGGRRSI